MAKPGMMKNIENVTITESDGVSRSMEYGRGSHQDPSTTQTGNRNPFRMNPAQAPAGPSGKADVEVSGVMDNQTSDYSSSTRTTYASRKRNLV